MQIVLCGKPGRCCPILNADKKTGTYIITDDYGGKVTLNKDQMKELQKVKL